MMMRQKRRNQRGFTLVELMIAVGIMGIVSVVVYQVFDQTSDNFLEVDNLADVDDRLRFSMQRVRADMRMASNQMSPDSDLDPWVEPAPQTSTVAGVMSYTGWQDNPPGDAGVAGNNPLATYDGIVVMGAMDYPLPFEMSGLVRGAGPLATGQIEGHYRGLMRLQAAGNPFIDGLTTQEEIVDPTQVDFLADNWTTRLIRIRDRQGFLQFTAPNRPLNFPGDFTAPAKTAVDPQPWAIVNVELQQADTELGPKFKSTAAGEFGLDEVSETDYGYESALLDAFWYHVVQDPNDPANNQLVRDRLCAEAVARNFGTAPGAMLASAAPCNGTDERVVVANEVADFQVWFDCADANGNIVAAPWGSEWLAPDNETTCMDPDALVPGRARVAHVRLTLHTPVERKAQRHIQFEDRNGALCDPDDPTICTAGDVGLARMQTFDVYPNVVGAARVSTLQSDFELPNFVARDLQ